MISRIQFIVVKIINRLLAMFRVIRMTSPRNKKNALISYVLTTPFYVDFYFKTTHNNKYKAYLMGLDLKKRGYNVYIYDYTDENIDYSRHYDLFLGHNYTFSKIASKLSPETRKALICTGSEAHFGNEQQRLRIIDVNRRKGTNLSIYEANRVPDLSINYKVADVMLILGNEFVKATYPPAYHHKIQLFDNVTLHPFFKRPEKKRSNTFLFISSLGQVHRGLDLVLDVFAKLPYKLFVMSAFKEEPDFEKIYEQELYHTENIIPLGFVSLNSNSFYNAVCESDFVLLPSCSEGQSSSVINLMAYGLIPVVTENTGLQHILESGVLIKTIDTNGVSNAIKEAVEMSDEEFHSKRNGLKTENKRYSRQGFLNTFDQALQTDNK
jgi:glycosyltransferase involved in cell wall biosynthesis